LEDLLRTTLKAASIDLLEIASKQTFHFAKKIQFKKKGLTSEKCVTEGIVLDAS